MRIVKDVYQHLATYLNDQLSPELKWVDLWYEQILIPELGDAIDYPAIFFEISANEIESNGLWEQRVFLRTSLYIAQVNYGETALKSSNMTKNLYYLEFLGKVHEILQGYEHPETGNLNRVAFQPVRTPTNHIIYRIDYDHVRADNTPMEKRRQTVSVPVTLEIQKPPAGQQGESGGEKLFFID